MYDTHACSLRHALKNATRPICSPPKLWSVALTSHEEEERSTLHQGQLLKTFNSVAEFDFFCFFVFFVVVINEQMMLIKARQNPKLQAPTCNKWDSY